jgi:hypothetical protein
MKIFLYRLGIPHKHQDHDVEWTHNLRLVKGKDRDEAISNLTKRLPTPDENVAKALQSEGCKNYFEIKLVELPGSDDVDLDTLIFPIGTEPWKDWENLQLGLAA